MPGLLEETGISHSRSCLVRKEKGRRGEGGKEREEEREGEEGREREREREERMGRRERGREGREKEREREGDPNPYSI